MLKHFSFLSPGQDLGAAIAGQYNVGLVLLSVLMVVVSTYTAFLISERIRSADSRGQEWGWQIIGAVTLGGGVWAMHFIGMLAYKIPLAVSYDVFITILSSVPAMLASLIILRAADARAKRWVFFRWSVLIGLGVGLMHYTGMAAMRMDGVVRYDPEIFGLSIIVAIVLAGVALRFKWWADQYFDASVIFSKYLLMASVMMGGAISAMHYTGMMTMTVFPGTISRMQGVAWSADVLIKIIVIVAMLIAILLVVAVTVSRRFDLHQQIKDSENRQRAILDNMVDAVITINEEGIVKTINRATELIFSYQSDELVGQNVGVIIPEADSTQHDDYFLKYRDKGDAKIIGVGQKVEGRRKDGTIFPLELAISEVRLGGQRMYIGILRDISERQRAETELASHREHLEELVQERTAEMKVARDESEKANQAKSEFLSRMSHELRTPMNAILGFGQILELDEKGFSDTQRANVKEIMGAGHHLLNLINEVLDLTKIESGELEVVMMEMPIDGIVQQSVALMQPLAAVRHIELVDHVSGSDYIVHADSIRFKQVLVNLLSNAVKYNRDNGSIMLDAEITDAHRLRIRVTDSGEGLSAEDIDKLFSPFERLNKANNVEGAGIGLVITKHLMELMGGSVGVESSLGKGSVFWVEFVLIN